MERIDQWRELTFNSLNEMGISIMNAIPNILGAILILIIGWIITKIIVFLLKRILRIAKADKLTELINEKNLFGETDLKFNVTSVIVGFVKWVLFLVFLIVASDIMNWEIVSLEIGKLLRYLPKLFSAIALFMVGLYIASFLKKAIRGLFESFDLNGAKIISSLVFYVIAIIITVTALNQAGIDTNIITNNLTIILGAFLAAMALGFGIGSKDIISDLLRTFYTRKNYEVGQSIEFNDVSGTIESIDNISMTLKTATGKIVIPIKDVVENQIRIIE
ncbi:mechanosensitive ion channel family protein [Ulvibacter antarcticus]|uniref:Putative transporter (Transmembrane protein) n=1 Tax=Ulvibacter antarcticus TaxID=442714 RepID=A0A3L9YGM5_9FLAO|nr:mechanosensitive ion channel domain-containing protein [Ulvibacter antarcticus]RMA58600.1 putative transporter (transmembrane protein) [Ulvibacter antarcticus]